MYFEFYRSYVYLESIVWFLVLLELDLLFSISFYVFGFITSRTLIDCFYKFVGGIFTKFFVYDCVNFVYFCLRRFFIFYVS